MRLRGRQVGPALLRHRQQGGYIVFNDFGRSEVARSRYSQNQIHGQAQCARQHPLGAGKIAFGLGACQPVLGVSRLRLQHIGARGRARFQAGARGFQALHAGLLGGSRGLQRIDRPRQLVVAGDRIQHHGLQGGAVRPVGRREGFLRLAQGSLAPAEI